VKLVLDMNFDGTRAEMLRSHGLDALHWSDVGHPQDIDPVVIAWARANRCVVVTQDLGIAKVLATTGADSPSVFQLRFADDLSPDLMSRIATAAKKHEKDLVRGCILVYDARTNRVRIRPLPTTPRG
jgi:predicted nuclease of predicted toxin-antitoxin system